MVSWKIVCVLTKFRENSPGKCDLFLWYFFLLENLMCSNEILDKISGKFWSIFLWYFFLLENRMCSCGILRKLSWRFWCVLVHFASSGKFVERKCVLLPFFVLLENLMCSYKRIMSSPGKFIEYHSVFSYYIQTFWKNRCVLEISLKSTLLKKKGTDILAK